MRLRHAGLLAAAFAAGLLVVAGASRIGAGSSERHAGVAQAAAPLAAPGESVSTASGWATKNLKGTVRLAGQVPPLSVTNSVAASGATRRGREIKLSFAFSAPRQGGARRADRAAGEDAPLPQPRAALRALLAAAGAGRRAAAAGSVARASAITHVGARPAGAHGASRRRRPSSRRCTSRSTTSSGRARRFRGLTVKPYRFYANTTAPDGAGAPRPPDASRA